MAAATPKPSVSKQLIAKDDLEASLRRIRRLAQRGDLAAALRLTDRAWRTMPEQQAALAPILGRLLLQQGSEPVAALQLLMRAAELRPSLEAETELIAALIATEHLEAALQRLGQALLNHACGPDGRLAQLARQLMQKMPAAIAGWVALDADFSLYAEVGPALQAPKFELLAADGAVLQSRQALSKKTHQGARARFQVAKPAQAQFLRVLAAGRPLLGGERVLPLNPRLEASCSARGRDLTISARLGWAADQEVELEIGDEHGRIHRQRTRKAQLRLDAERLRLGSRLTIKALLPDGRAVELADSPLLFKPALLASLKALRASLPPPAARKRAGRPLPVDVVIPVYQGRAETLACIESVLRTAADFAASILVVDDASPDPALSADLDALAAAGRIRLLRNERNLGFSATINRALAEHPEHDAVLVNADALVFGDWLQRLQAAAYRAPNIASVTPFADDDSVARYVQGGDAALSAQLDAYAREAHRGCSVELPVGVGFCLYLRRAAWREVGELDAATFGKGYGEESDWCMRARQLGWQHRLAADVFVHHAGGASFGARRLALLQRAHRLMALRHPGYHRQVQAFLKQDSLREFRRSFDRHRLLAQRQPVVLMVMLGLTGGVDRYVGERCRQLQAQGKFPLLLRPVKFGPEACMLWSFAPRLGQLYFGMPGELAALRQLLQQLPIESVELHHFLGLDARLVQTALQLGVPYDAYLHDYSWICPRVTLMNETGRYCGEPDLAGCERCVQRNGSDLMEEIGVAALRRRSLRWLSGARRVIAPSHDVAQRFARYAPKLAITVEPLERRIAIPPPPVRQRRGTTRVAILGAIGQHKGYHVLLACARDAARRRLDLEFVLIGFSVKDAPLLQTGKVFVTGKYHDGEVPGLLRREQPDLIWLPSVWPETWCYTLSHAMASGLPVVAFDIGAMAERLREHETGELLPLQARPLEINDRLIEIAARSGAEAPLFV
ncbi:Glycosyltransferase, GT2 family [Solimonas aquatica]|uniref:Glycosyltransferase, GT2 family n=1 Tax=Solimonas aquatica TaxID=489703 RepID=A0A1H9BTQ8_9GAMM|nr:Glycosyltransferase, GT2 family [Solimonas aquatica]